MKSEALPNSSQVAPSGAGIQAAQTIANKGAKLVITGSVGPNAYQVLSSAGVEIITGVDGTVNEAIIKFKNDELRVTTTRPNPTMDDEMEKGYSVGLGREHGLVRGRGMGFRRWHTIEPVNPSSIDSSPIRPTSAALSKEQKIQALEKQMNILQQQMDQLTKKLEALKNKYNVHI
jgi:predicted Fe-Mo cluster-binding NifX family protein